jgi:hypothetical protein
MMRRACLAILLAACEPKGGTAAPTSAGEAEPVEPGEAKPHEDRTDRPPPTEQVLRIEGGLKEAQVEEIIEKYFREIRECFDAGLASNPQAELDGAIVVAIEVAADGKVTEAKSELNETGIDVTEECIVAEVGKWTFPKPKGKATIHYPFYLRSY